ncbi:MAG: DUF5652 family protein [Candidatus Marinimicrobia bacterium]|nr:DUF5652 family protein [Candidatus Neomarinimicrobiota bacterium]
MEQMLQDNWWMFLALLLWVLPWKGVALWKASRLGQKWWFIALLVFNTLALLEIFYIFFIAKGKGVEIIQSKDKDLIKK